ncbi:MAG: hypothetical protein IKM08_04290 [Clostridia bacterium]|nr:hypothetical protein [Clostridia bacterium]
MSDCKKSSKLRAVLTAPFKRLAENKIALAVYITVHILIVITIVRGFFNGDPRFISISFLAIALMLIPVAVKLLFGIRLSTVLEVLAYLFIFSAQILGEIHHFYSIFPFWDAVLHVISGFMFAAFGYCLVDIFHKRREVVARLSPLFITLLAFCFSMTVGVFWEFIEFGGDTLMGKDMQKDAIVNEFHTILVPNRVQEQDPNQYVHHFTDVQRMELYDSEGNLLAQVDGYLDIGLVDSMKDMILNCIGALAFCVLGYFSIRKGERGRIAGLFIPKQKEDGKPTEAEPVPEHTAISQDQ